jgi:(2Fe-2S) ferredoxin
MRVKVYGVEYEVLETYQSRGVWYHKVRAQHVTAIIRADSKRIKVINK